MADRVIVTGVRRGGSLVPVSEIRQMIGRAGREHDKSGEAHIVVDCKDECFTNTMFEEGVNTVESSLSNPDVLAGAMLPEICADHISCYDDAVEWCSQSFCSNPPVDKAIEVLKKVDAIKQHGVVIMATETGMCAHRFYFHPADVYAWRENFSMIFELGLENEELAPAWALGNVPYERITGDLRDRTEIFTECKDRLPIGLEVMDGCLTNVIAWWYLTGGPSPGASLRPACKERRSDFGRVLNTLKCLDSNCMGWDKGDFFNELDIMVKKGIGRELIPLCRAGFSKNKAAYLYEMGARDIDDLEEIRDKIEVDIDEEFAQEITQIARKSGGKSGKTGTYSRT